MTVEFLEEYMRKRRAKIEKQREDLSKMSPVSIGFSGGELSMLDEIIDIIEDDRRGSYYDKD